MKVKVELFCQFTAGFLDIETADLVQLRGNWTYLKLNYTPSVFDVGIPSTINSKDKQTRGTGDSHTYPCKQDQYRPERNFVSNSAHGWSMCTTQPLVWSG